MQSLACLRFAGHLKLAAYWLDRLELEPRFPDVMTAFEV